MLALEKVEKTRRLLNETNLSQRKIAKLLGVSRGTVSAIASGRRPDYEARRQAQAVFDEPLGPVVRCPECGGKVYAPCRLCHVRKLKTHEASTARAFRRQARQLAAKRLLAAVRKANHDTQTPNPYLPADGTRPSDCK